MKSFFPVVTVVAAVLLIWIIAVVPMNMHLTADQAQRDGLAVSPDTPIARQDFSGLGLAVRNSHLIPLTYVNVRPRLPSPHQIAIELYDTVIDKKITSKRSLVYHGWVTLAPTLLGFAIGTLLGIMLAVGIVFSRVMDRSVMPWAIVSQTIPILALAPMIIVVMGAAGIQGILPKAVIAAYLSFFPVVVGMVKGHLSFQQFSRLLEITLTRLNPISFRVPQDWHFCLPDRYNRGRAAHWCQGGLWRTYVGW